jgi:hypothetical protein
MRLTDPLRSTGPVTGYAARQTGRTPDLAIGGESTLPTRGTGAEEFARIG